MKKIERRNKENTTDELTKSIKLDRPSVGIDVDYYQAAIDDPEVSDERKRELIEIIGAIVINFIDIGFGVHPVQLAQKDNGGLQQEFTQLSEQETPPLQYDFEKENTSERSDV